ncbi:hypothetical protein [Vibrio sp. 10N]|uniref:hypothetical protein n=1 Tax=Vibrio sp. 10N TaxID=3058938 RepID=UPI0028133311|nr:hypothetical protein VB10N_19250 [Vibrio sp. 10N]
MQEQGSAHFESIKEFKRAFLPIHKARVEAGKNIENSEEVLKDSIHSIRTHTRSFKGVLSSVESYLPKNAVLLESSLEKYIKGGKPSPSFEEAQKHAQAFNHLNNHLGQLSKIPLRSRLSADITNQLTEYSQALPSKWKPVQDILESIRETENEFFTHYRSLLKQKEEQQRREREEEERKKAEIEAQAALVAARRKSLKKKLIWTMLFLAALGGFIQTQMV